MSRNIPASVSQRLRDLAGKRNEDFALVLTKYGLERVLFRLGRSRHKEVFVLKGALLFELWTQDRHRPTHDMDLLAYVPNELGRLIAIFQEICSDSFAEDGLTFDTQAFEAERIKEDADYEGVRLRFVAYLANIRIPIQVDIGFGDVVTPKPIQVQYPTLLNFPAPVLSAYPRETVVAEKSEAMVNLGIANSRMKDFHDLNSLATLFAFEGAILAKAVAETFARRKTAIPKTTPTALTEAFHQDSFKRQQWAAFIQRNRLYIEAPPLPVVMAALARFLMPVFDSLSSNRPFLPNWPPGGPWDEDRRKT